MKLAIYFACWNIWGVFGVSIACIIVRVSPHIYLFIHLFIITDNAFHIHSFFHHWIYVNVKTKSKNVKLKKIFKKLEFWQMNRFFTQNIMKADEHWNSYIISFFEMLWNSPNWTQFCECRSKETICQWLLFSSFWFIENIVSFLML